MSKSKPKLRLASRSAKGDGGTNLAWWYENENSIDVVIQLKAGRSIGSAQITRRQIESWLKKLEAK